MIDRSTPTSGVVDLRLNRPPVNALSHDLLRDLSAALEGTFTEGARAVVISGQPGIFSAGLDIPLLLRLDKAEMSVFWETFFRVLQKIACSPVPIGFAITGHCPAGGTVLSLFGDFRIAADGDYRLGLNETEVGLPMPPLVFRAFRRLVGARAAEQLAVAGRLIGPEEARAVGLVDEVVACESVIPNAVRRAAALAALPAHALSVTRAEARSDLRALFEGVGQATYEGMTDSWFASETQTALHAFLGRLAARKGAEGC